MTDMPPPPPPPNMGPPPGYVAYGSPGAVGGQVQRTGALAKWLVALLAITLAVQALSLVLQLTLAGAAEDLINDSISSATFDDKIGLFVAIMLLLSAVGIGQLVVLIVWTYRLAKNHQAIGRTPLTFKPGATIAVNILGGCTLGILNFFMWREIWRASDPEATTHSGWKQGPISTLLYIYLTATLLSVASSFALGFSSSVSFGTTNVDSGDLAERLNDQLAVVLVSGGLSLVAAGAFLMFVRQLSARHMQAIHETA